MECNRNLQWDPLSPLRMRRFYCLKLPAATVAPRPAISTTLAR